MWEVQKWKNVNTSVIKICQGDPKLSRQIESEDLLDFIALMHFVQRKDIKLGCVSVFVERRVNVVQGRQFEFHVVSQEGVEGEVAFYYFNVFSGINTFLIILPIIFKQIEIGGCYEMEMNVEKTKVKRISRQPFPVKIVIDQNN